MKKVLLVSYYWPPAGGPGSIRLVKFAKYLPDFGWQPIILTIKDGEFSYYDTSLEKDLPHKLIIQKTDSFAPFTLYKKLTGRRKNDPIPVAMLTQPKRSLIEKIAAVIRINLFIPDARIGWIPFAIREANRLIQEKKIDLIFTSSPPHSSQLIGLWIKHKLHIPWVADLRDPWTGIRYYENQYRSLFAKKIDNTFEKKVLTKSDQIITVSQSLANAFSSKLNGFHPDKCLILPNGFDEDDFNLPPLNHITTFNIIYTGNLQANQNPEILWYVINKIIDEKNDLKNIIRVRLIGRIHPHVLERIKAYRLEEIVNLEDFKPHSEILNEQKNAALLLMVVPRVKNNLGIVTGKFFEYLGANKPILVIGPPGSDIGKVLKPMAESNLIDYDDQKKCELYLKSSLEKWQSGNWKFNNLEHVKEFSRKSLTKKLAKVFDKLIC
jgi:glycosyltransferase involved in cell wall biosynthesis